MRFQLLAAAITALAFADEVADNAEPALVDAGDEATLGDYYYDNVNCNSYVNYAYYYYGT